MVNIPQGTNYIIALIIALVMVLTGYQTLELTRYIVVNGWLGWPEMGILSKHPVHFKLHDLVCY
jgi:hypothetical protein